MPDSPRTKQRAYLPGGVDMGAAADFHTERGGVISSIGHPHYPHGVAVLVAKESQGPLPHGGGIGAFLSGYGQIFPHLAVSQALHRPLLLRGQRPHMAEIKA